MSGGLLGLFDQSESLADTFLRICGGHRGGHAEDNITLVVLKAKLVKVTHRWACNSPYIKPYIISVKIFGLKLETCVALAVKDSNRFIMKPYNKGAAWSIGSNMDCKLKVPGFYTYHHQEDTVAYGGQLFHPVS